MPLIRPHLQTWRSSLVPSQRTANLSRAIILGTLLFATPLNSSLAQDTGAVPQANLIRSTPTRQKSRFNGIMSARSTDPAHSFVVEREEEEGQTT